MLYLTQRLEIPAAATASVTLPIDVRVKSRVKVTLNDGREAGLLLPARPAAARRRCAQQRRRHRVCAGDCR